MELKPGRYHVEASKRGYETQKMWVQLDAGDDKKVGVNLERLQASIQPTTFTRPSSSNSDVIKRDGIYVAYVNGIVKVTKMGLEWKVGPDRDTDWNEASSWVRSLNLNGGGWRMPTMDELAGLYKKGAGSRNMTPLLKTTGWDVWSGETVIRESGSSNNDDYSLFDSIYNSDPSDAGGLNFTYCTRFWSDLGNSASKRAFAVRSRGDDFYVDYANGIVKDTSTGLEWKAGPDEDTDWNEASSWVRSLNLNGGGWRMPSMDELAGLYKKGMGTHNVPLLLKATSVGYLRVWSGETNGSSDDRLFYFNGDTRLWYDLNYSSLTRAFAVRSRGGG